MVSDAAAERFMTSPLLHELDSASRVALLNTLVEARALPGTKLLQQGHPYDCIAFLIEGNATVSRERKGRTESLTTLTAPAVFGLTTFFRPTPPDFTVTADTPVWLLTFDHHAYSLLRRVDLKAAEQLALAALRHLAGMFDLLLDRVSADMDAQPDDSRKINEWASFRARLFEETKL
jgi:CRP-like cAMP-binding protein